VAYTPSSTEVLSFKIAGMVMPPSLKPPAAVVIITKVGTTTFYNVDSASVSNLFVSTVGSLTEFSSTPSNLQAYVTTTYTFTFRPQHNILQGGYVTVDIPSQISINDAATSAAS
jgi:hypothetical protein